jgi:hypothetical protein
MNSADNLRIKTQEGNRVVDEYHDAIIAQAFIDSTPIEHQGAADRAFQALQGAESFSNPAYADALGNLQVRNPKTGRLHYLDNHGDYQ